MADVDTEVIETGETKESIIEAAVAAAESAEGSTQSTETTTEATEPSIAELREAAGDTAEGLSDEELRAEWKKAQDAPDEFTLPNGLKLYGEDGKEISDLAKVTLAQLLSDKVQWGYNALGKEQKKALTEVFRNASLGHYNEQKMLTLADERKRAYDLYTGLKTEHEAWAKDRQVWLGVLTAASQGNIEPLKQLLKTYQESSTTPFEQTQTQPVQEAEWNQAGMQWVTTEANRIAEQFGANPLEIAQAIVHLANQEPAEFLTQEKLNAIVQYEIPALLERYNYAQKQGASSANDPRDVEIAAMKKQIAELTAGQKNAVTQRLREKAKKAPSAGGGRAPAAGDSVPNFKSREDYRKWIRGEAE